ncbi:SDR family oxidoreductase [Streptomyces erythrochromogenes]|uniref:SDR family oxidoreductase n=1 Tax=Streptomyces erythrochromogenes TaxID=285574 RepID=UPI0030B8959D
MLVVHCDVVTVLITGASGFVGSRLAYELVVGRGQRVVCLMRGSLATAHQRLREMVGAYGALSEEARRRLLCVTGDVTREWLGMSAGHYARLADEVTGVWHCAGDIALAGERERLFRVNTHGTANVLQFAELTAAHCRVVHVSTMAVAGGRRDGIVLEDDLTDVYGFATHYDASKFQAEQLVRAWTHRTQRPAVVLRPSIVCSDAPAPQGVAGHPLAVFGQMIDVVARGGAPGIPAPAQRPGSFRLRLRLRVSPEATVNIVPDRYATQAMLRIGHDACHEGPRAHTFHVVHGQPTPVRDIIDVIEAHYPRLRLECVEDVPDPTPAEQFIAQHLTGFFSYSRHRRTYDRTHALAAAPDLAEPVTIDAAYLRRALGFEGAPA